MAVQAETSKVTIKKPKKTRGAWHNPMFTKITFTGWERRQINKKERQRKKQARRRK